MAHNQSWVINNLCAGIHSFCRVPYEGAVVPEKLPEAWNDVCLCHSLLSLGVSVSHPQR